MAFGPGLPGWASTRKNTHQLTPILIIGHPLSTSSIYYDPWHPLCSVCMLGGPLWQSLQVLLGGYAWIIYALPPLSSCKNLPPYFFHGAFAPSFIWRRRPCIQLPTYADNVALPTFARRLCSIYGRAGLKCVEAGSEARVVGCWCGCLSGARCRQLYDLHIIYK